MKKYRMQARELKKCLEELNAILEVVNSQLSMAVDVERKVYEIDKNLPTDAAVNAMPEGEEKEEILDLFDMINLSYDALDEIFGEDTDSPMTEVAPESGAPTARAKKTIVS